MTDKNAMYWTRYGYHINDPAIKAVVEGLEVHRAYTPEELQPLADLLNKVDLKEGKGLWVSDATSPEWNVGICYVAYNGPNEADFPTKRAMKNVLVLEFFSESTAPVGRLYIPYND